MPFSGLSGIDKMLEFQMPVIESSPTIRYRVDLVTGYISYSAQDVIKALTLFKEQGLRLRICKDIFDEGRVIAGEPEKKE